jgi:alpha-D-xyloside xylohydrolase
MRYTPFAKYLSLLLLASSCSSDPVKQSDNGIVVKLDSAKAGVRQIKIDVISDRIIHVVATPYDTFPREKSLIVVPDLKRTGTWRVEKSNDIVSVATKSLTASVSLATGSVTFQDSTGKVLLKEYENGGKMFKPGSQQNKNEVQAIQRFHSPANEAFYGLGGHQNGQMNYKGEDVELAQHNIVDVIPFLYSSENYGLLWDNYSISRFGDTREYQPLNSLQLFSRDGQPGGLSADYYVNDKIVKSAIEDKIDYEYLETPQVDNFPKDIAQKGKVVWEGTFASDVEGAHKFLVYASGYFKVWVDDKLILDKWRQNWNPWSNKFTTNVKKGEKHKLKIEWISEGGYLAVKHLDPVPVEQQNDLSLSSEVADKIDYYFIHGKNADDVISGYRLVTGKAPIVPSWAMGFWQSRERYRSQNELIDVVKEYRKRNIPLDNIVLDWQYWEDPKWGSHEFDVKRFPDPKGMIVDLHKKYHAQLMISVWPKFNTGTDNYNAMNKNGFLFTRNVDKKRKDWVGVGYESTFYDPFNEKAGAMFWNQIDTKLNKLGVDAWWLDATEPDMHSNLSIDERKNNMSPTALGSGAKYFNAYSLMNSKSVYEGQRKSSPDKRVFILTRSAFAGQQRYGAATWSGDIVSRWSDFKDQIATGINFSLSGIPYWTMDIGGFAVERKYYNASGETLKEWRELNTRWFQFGAFCPLFRSHGQYPFREIYNISQPGDAAYESMVFYDNLRYKLMPYIYSLCGKSYFNDYTIMRGLVMDFPSDKKVRSIGDQYMFGSALLINPVYEMNARSRAVYLPSDYGWYDLYSGKYYQGGSTIQADAPLDRMPLFVKEGSIVPAGPAIQFTNEKPADPITLYVYTGKNGAFELYEDEGVNYNYENGAYSFIPMSYDESSKTLTIGDRIGSFPGMLKERKFEIVWVNNSRPVGMSLNAHPDQVVTYVGTLLRIKQ